MAITTVQFAGFVLVAVAVYRLLDRRARLVWLLLASQHVNASQYSPPGLYEIDHVTLQNGLGNMVALEAVIRPEKIDLHAGAIPAKTRWQ
mgnify:CR=1 FL=1